MRFPGAAPPPGEGEEPIYSSDFKCGMTIEEIHEKFDEMYKSNKRLPKRAYFDEKTGLLRLPFYERRGGDVKLSLQLIEGVAHHIERAFELKYIDAVFFPDMGHAHLQIPDDLWTSKYTHFEVANGAAFYSELYTEPRLELLYHTAEQLKMTDENREVLDDERIRFRIRTRSITAPITTDSELTPRQNPGHKVNTVREIPGYKYYSAGFDLSANENGCFEFMQDGTAYRFDISFFPLEPDPNSDQGWGAYSAQAL